MATKHTPITPPLYLNYLRELSESFLIGLPAIPIGSGLDVGERAFTVGAFRKISDITIESCKGNLSSLFEVYVQSITKEMRTLLEKRYLGWRLASLVQYAADPVTYYDPGYEYEEDGEIVVQGPWERKDYVQRVKDRRYGNYVIAAVGGDLASVIVKSPGGPTSDPLNYAHTIGVKCYVAPTTDLLRYA